MFANESGERDGGGGGAANAAENDVSGIKSGDGDGPSDQVTAAVANATDGVSVGSGHGELTTVKFLATTPVDSWRAMARYRELNPQYRADAGFIDPTTLRNDEIAAIFHFTLIRTYIQRVDIIRSQVGHGPTANIDLRV